MSADSTYLLRRFSVYTESRRILGTNLCRIPRTVFAILFSLFLVLFIPFVTFYYIAVLYNSVCTEGHLPIQQPVFKSLPMTIKSEENETVFLPCVIDYIGESAIRWWKGEILLSDSSSPIVAVQPKLTVMRDGMTINNLEPEDTGDYTCEIVRPKPWSSLRITHKLQVMYPPKIFRIPTDGYLEVRLGEKGTIGCTALGVPPPVIRWKGKNLFVKLAEESPPKIEFTAMSRYMTGTYQCEADNGIGDPVHANIFLRVLHKPEVTVEKAWVHSAPSIRTSLVCQIVADPDPQVEWFFNDEKLVTSGPRITYQVRGVDHIIMLVSVRPSDFGNYTCRASNGLGVSQGFIQLSGVANPAVIKKAEVLQPEDFSLVWEVDSYSPIIEYKLHFRKVVSNAENSPWVSFIIPADGLLSGPLHSKSYNFSGLDKFSVYEAKVFSRNRFGWSNSSEVVAFGFTSSKYKPGTEASNEINEISSASSLTSILTGVFCTLLAITPFL